MVYPQEEQFLSLLKKGNLIPVYRQILADTETPVSAYLKIAKGSYSFLLESVEGRKHVGRYSFLSGSPQAVLVSEGKKVVVKNLDEKTPQKFICQKDPLEQVKHILSGYRFVEVKGLPRFCGGMVGFMGYDCVRFFEPKLKQGKKESLGFFDMMFMLAKDLLIFDHVDRTIKIVSCAYVKKGSSLNQARQAYRRSLRKIDEVQELLNKRLPIKKISLSKTAKLTKAESNVSKKEFMAGVRKAKTYIKNGDIIQVVLSQRFSKALNSSDFDIYRNLRSINPSPYMFFFKLGKISLAGSSPEMLVRCEDKLVETRPIAGTRPRGRNEKEDELFKRQLLNDPKELAEHTMLVDLGRNDLGRVCKYDSINLKEFMNVEMYSHVMHIVSSIKGSLSKDKDMFDLLRASFPAGTVTGAPKVRAMEIIEELEKSRRGPYAGCVGYFSFSGNLDTCITIRTVLVKANTAYVQAGAGIVADSIPEKEYEETVGKARGMLEAIS